MVDGREMASGSLFISLGVTLVAFFLGLRQWYERQSRETDLSEFDRGYFARQDLRRAIGVVVMVLLAVGMWVGARLEPTTDRRANLGFVGVWLAVIGLIIVLLALALTDWWATRRYARRMRRSIARERVELLREALHKYRAQPRDSSATDNSESPS
jgi:protein-S-isoprenylcysteine O-methyltransferase Ste14